MKPTYVAALACHVWQSCSATCIFNLSNVFLWIFWVAEHVFIMWIFNVFFVACLFLFWFSFCFFHLQSLGLVWQVFVSRVAVWCLARGSSSSTMWQCRVLCVGGVCFWRGSVVSCAWQGFLSDVAVWCLARGKGSFLTWQCGAQRCCSHVAWMTIHSSLSGCGFGFASYLYLNLIKSTFQAKSKSVIVAF